MRKSLVPLTVGLIFGSAVWVVKATPLSDFRPQLLKTIHCWKRLAAQGLAIIVRMALP